MHRNFSQAHPNNEEEESAKQWEKKLLKFFHQSLWCVHLTGIEGRWSVRRDNEKEIVGRQHVGMFTQTEAVIVRLRTRWSSKSIEEHCPLPTDWGGNTGEKGKWIVDLITFHIVLNIIGQFFEARVATYKDKDVPLREVGEQHKREDDGKSNCHSNLNQFSSPFLVS